MTFKNAKFDLFCITKCQLATAPNIDQCGCVIIVLKLANGLMD